MKNLEIVCINEVGLHARPAALFVQAANRFKAKIRTRNLTNGTEWVDAKSILRVLSLGVEHNHSIEISAEGDDEEIAVRTLENLVLSDFVEQK
jgi:phosphotransferase system HPr (HPr) family protein